jgi:hypothetical protein
MFVYWQVIISVILCRRMNGLKDSITWSKLQEGEDKGKKKERRKNSNIHREF